MSDGITEIDRCAQELIEGDFIEKKTVVCKNCGTVFEVSLRIGELELRDGWHGECPAEYCMHWYFEACKTYPPTKKGDHTLEGDIHIEKFTGTIEQKFNKAKKVIKRKENIIKALCRRPIKKQNWLNGWLKEKDNDIIKIDRFNCCIGCGRMFGTTCVVLDPTWQHPEKDPDWPFLQDDCPICSKEYCDLTVDDIAKYLSILRKAIEILKIKNAGDSER